LKKLMLICALLLSSGFLYGSELHCSVSQGLVEVSIAEVTVFPGEKSSYETLEGYMFAVKNLGDSKFELDVFDSSTPSRSYSSGSLRSSSDSLSWTYWSRETLIETTCRLKQ